MNLEQAVQACKKGDNILETSKRYNIPYATLYRKVKQCKVDYTPPDYHDISRICFQSEVKETLLVEKIPQYIVIHDHGQTIFIPKHKFKQFAQEMIDAAEVWC